MHPFTTIIEPFRIKSVEAWKFTTREERRRTGAWWNRKFIGDYAPAVTSTPETPRGP